ncbi:FadR/GntR family transcriptional regulator [Desulfopila aestuarii]|uniref:GntR family transcriptional regulator, transcriptional repressor for pyruvate dehydrogenase complex n=1 Tax=Desulfopila aestuarii DSM 18488 TaxID=1121416 RepID=A0A1M7XYD1_9BACT|nr:FadR/GntR family transcriptional regulator [Desulfopila aestuarii]SHO44044.1 GntR family transcriptional regulator, transcriptional repressor for pyruvate dehydrogenase complex [Desulfopila aestuarii DSM 18488]
MIKPVKHRNVADLVHEQLRDMIYRGEIEPGGRLMSERDMSERFQVGRPTIRTAIQRLISQGLVESRRGVGVFVLDQDQAIDKRPLLQALNGEVYTIADIQEIRMALEVKSAELAAKRATDEDIRLLKKGLERIQKERIENRIRINTDISFHMNIAYASKNVVQIHLMKSFYEVQTYAMSYSYINVLESLNIGEMVDRQHEEILAAIVNHDPIRARQAMEAHIGAILEICLEHGL